MSHKTASSGIRAKGLKLGKRGAVEYEAPVNLIGQVNVQKPVRIGCYTYVVGPTRLGNVRSIGRYCSIAPGVSIAPSDHPTTWLSTSPFQFSASKFQFSSWHDGFEFTARTRENDPARRQPACHIGNDVWIGAGAIILGGASISDGAIVAAGSVVTRSVPPYAIVAGIPAKLVRMRFPDDVIERLLMERWWRFDASSLSGLPFDDPVRALDELQSRISAGTVHERLVEYRRLAT